MKYKFQNENFLIEVNGIGAELCSFKNKHTDLEYIWQGDSQYWGSTAPVLFPIIGALKNGAYTHKGKEYSVPKHGFIRHNEELEVRQISETEIRFSLASTNVLKKSYPFDFKFFVSFLLEDNKLIVSHEIENTGETEMLFSLGGHPAFNCPFLPDEQYEDYFIEFDQEQTLETTVLSENGLLTDEQFEVISGTNKVQLTDTLFDNDALIFRDISSKTAELKSQNHNHSVKVSYSDFKDLGIWAKPKVPFVCIEPWLGVTDHENATGDLKDKDGIISLPAGDKYEASFTIEIN
ncbi:MAG: aldose 1-epimerase family protein [Salibacteraceae bacterium]